MELNCATARRQRSRKQVIGTTSAVALMPALLVAMLLVSGDVLANVERNDWTFRVLLDGRQIGRHQFTLQADDAGEFELRSTMQIDVRMLFVSVYRYQHEAVERWHGNCLRSLVSHTETNGERETVSATTHGDVLSVKHAQVVEEHAGCIMSFAYWNPQILLAQRLLNSETGELLPVSITAEGTETVAVRGEPLTASHYRISGPRLQIDLWYAGDLWVALEAMAQGGRRLRYELI